jgi:hypothetical protein
VLNLHIINRGLRFYTRNQDADSNRNGQSLREGAKMKNYLYLTACIGLAVALSGCSSTSCGNGFSLFKNRPVRTRLQSWFGGAPCSTCFAPAGQPTNYGTNVAPLCDSCGLNADPGIQLYNETNLNGPLNNQIIQNPSPIYPDGSIQGGVGNGGVQPPNF